MWIAETIDLDNHDSVIKFMTNQSDKIKKLEKENEQLKQENKGIQEKVWKLLELLEKEKGIDKRKIIKWWNGDV